MIKKVLIANRGEIAVRIIRCCKSMGIGTVAIFEKGDGCAWHTELADESYELSGSYLDISNIVEIARECGADGVHPGYGFLAENSEFAEAVIGAGLVFIGPAPETISLCGDKVACRKLAKKLSIPLLPSSELSHKPEDKSLSKKTKEFCAKAGFPVLIKSAFGGGGRGMRLANSEEELLSNLHSAARESQAHFSNSKLYLEKYVQNGRHIEVQILGDKYGNVIHLFERDCTYQRRHQKIIEESPAANISAALRKNLHEAAVKLGSVASYLGAGTVEFLVDG